ncbi:MAG: deoxyribodipyrimidine photo-lyase, partial [Chitinophagaceae bacterium]
MLNTQPINIFWFRRDLRLNDNHGLFRALNADLPVIGIFIFDKTILSKLDNPLDKRVSFIHQQVNKIKKETEISGSTLITRYGNPAEVFSELTDQLNINAVYANEDYEPLAIQRDKSISQLLSANGIGFHLFKDQVIFSKQDIIKPNGEPYTIFTPYSKKWLARANSEPNVPGSFASEKLCGNFLKLPPEPIIALEAIGFKEVRTNVMPLKDDPKILQQYANARDKLYADGTSHSGVHLRFGTVSVRDLVRKGFRFSPTFLSELIWREFFQSILFHFPQVGRGASFKPAYDNIAWRNDEEEFEKWCEGKTGYPVVDAGMRELSESGFMHNRARMIT